MRCDSGTSLYTLGFPNSGKSWGKIPPHPVGMELEILQGGSFLPGERNLRRNDFDNLNLFQSEKQLSVNTEHKTKINMTCVSREYEIKTKMEQEQWLQLKVLFLLDNSLKIVA